MVLFPSSLCHCLWIPPLYMQERGLLLFCLRLPNDSVSARETINRTRYWKDEWNRYLIVMYNICAWRSPSSFPWKFFCPRKLLQLVMLLHVRETGPLSTIRHSKAHVNDGKFWRFYISIFIFNSSWLSCLISLYFSS